MTDYVATLVHLVPEANISYKGAVVKYENIQWNDERTQPTKAECDEAWPIVEYNQAYAAVERARKQRYETETDGVFFAAMRSGDALTDWIDAVNAIKSDLPYPDAI